MIGSGTSGAGFIGRPRIRAGQPADLEALHALSLICFPSEHWTPAGLREELDRETSICLVSVGEAGGVTGFLVAWRVLDEIHLLRIATHPECRRQGVAAELLQALLEQDEASTRVVYLEVRASNHQARSLYEKRGFRTLGVRKAYYANPTEDAVLMVWTREPDR